MIAVALLLAASPTAPPPIPVRPGECRTLRARAFLANGTPSVRLWVTGTRRILGSVQHDLSYQELPATLRRTWARSGRARWQTDIYGDFTVCAVSPSRPGRMQMVRVVAARNLTARTR